jgi:malate permease and related proteins
VILVALAIVASTWVGAAAERRWGEGARGASRRTIDLLVWVLYPLITFFVITRLELDAGVGGGLAIGYVALATVGLLAFAAGRALRLRREQTGALVVVTILANTGYLGIPLCAALLGDDALGPAIAWDTAVSGPMFYGAAFAVGAAFGTAAGETPGERFRAFLRNPPLIALVAGLLAPDALAPDLLVDIAEVLAFAVLPLGFFVLGVNLAAEHQSLGLDRAVATALGLRLLVAPALVAGIAALTVDLPDAYLVQAAMPSGINSLVVAHTYGLDVRLTAAAIGWSTAIVIAAALVIAAF